LLDSQGQISQQVLGLGRWWWHFPTCAVPTRQTAKMLGVGPPGSLVLVLLTSPLKESGLSFIFHPCLLSFFLSVPSDSRFQLYANAISALAFFSVFHSSVSPLFLDKAVFWYNVRVGVLSLLLCYKTTAILLSWLCLFSQMHASQSQRRVA
jgi:hypothetical protein